MLQIIARRLRAGLPLWHTTNTSTGDYWYCVTDDFGRLVKAHTDRAAFSLFP